MHALGIAPASADGVAATVADRLAERGRVGVGEPGDADAPTRTTYRVGADGWSAAGRGGSLDDALDRLAADHDYAVVRGFPEARVPHLVVGDAETRGEVVYRATDADDVDLDAVVAAVEDAEPFETLGSLVARAKRSPDAEYAGAIATFTGRVRAREGPDDEFTDQLEFEKYEGVAADRLAALRDDLESRDRVHEVLMHHRTGVVEYGEDIVFVVVLAGHREEAFRTVEDGIDRLKEEVPIFKKEVTVGDEFWVHDRE
jgi:molybdopterin synthase catalytic subunit